MEADTISATLGFLLPKPKIASPIHRRASWMRAGGGFDYSYNAQTAVKETTHIIATAEVVNTLIRQQNQG